MLDIISSFIVGLFLSVAFLLDLFISKKTKGAFLRAFIYALSVALPTIYSGEFMSQIVYGFFIGSIIGVFLVYFGVYKKAIKKLENYDGDDENLEFFNLLMNGYDEFKKNIDKRLEVIKKEKEKYNKAYVKVHEELAERLPKFVLSIYSYKYAKDYDFSKYSTYVMQSFINEFFSNSNARFTLRIYDKEKSEMITSITTRDVEPSNIPLLKKNMISYSLEKNKPLIYSENKEHHYDTNCSIQKKVFDDYVTYCIEADNKTPVISVNLDVKGEEAVNRMKAFVKTNIFTIVCDAIALNYKLKKELKENV